MIIQQHIKFEDQDEHRLYEIWPGKNRFFFGGRLMTGSDADFHINLFTWVGLLLLPITFQYGHGQLVWEASKPLAISSIFLGFLTLFFLLLTQFSDPGIIPRQHIFEIIGKTWETENSWPICSTCQIKKPPGTSHCKQCDNCVQLLDHHCPFVNNCIGKRNYKYFVMFLACLLFQGLDIIISLNKIDPKGNNNLTDFLLIIVCFVSAIIGIFCFFHLIVILSGSTTRQIIKDLESTDRFDWVGNSPQLFDPMFNINQQAEQLV